MKFITLLALVAVACAAMHAASEAQPMQVTQRNFAKWMCQYDETCVDPSKDSFHRVASSFLKRMQHFVTDFDEVERTVSGGAHFTRAFAHLKSYFHGRKPTVEELKSLIQRHHRRASATGSYPYFAWLPMPVASSGVIPGGPAVQYSTPCFQQVSAQAVYLNASFLQVTFTTANQVSFLCTDTLLITGGGGVALKEFDMPQQYVVVLNASYIANDSAEQWYLNHNGVQVMRFNSGLLDLIGEIIDTVTLIEGFAMSPLTDATIMDNYHFLREYVQSAPRMQPKVVNRTVGNIVGMSLDPSLIQAGDAFLVLRPDGLDAMIGWGEGSDVGHSTIAMRFPGNDTLHVCESTTKDGYWPTNGIQCHEWSEWLQLSTSAEMNIVWLPLDPAHRALFDASKAAAFFKTNEGLDYGFATFLFGWIDTAHHNFPCLPPDFNSTCLTLNAAELLAHLLDRVFGSNHINFFRQALTHRTNTWPADNPVVDSLMIAQTKMNLDFGQLIVLPEQDAWLYNTTRNGTAAVGKSMVCCVFVCNMWKAAGVFGNLADEIQCGEQTLWDIYSMQIFDHSQMNTGRPAVCKQYDPTNPLCQLMGNFSLFLNPDVNTRPLYAKMGQNCTSVAPNYIREPGC